MSAEVKPLDVRKDVFVQMIELLKHLDPDSQLRTLQAVAVFLGFEVNTGK